MVQRIEIEDIKSVESVDVDTVFDISMQDNHNYYIDNQYGGYLVHNSTKTWSGCFFIMYLALIKHAEYGCTINIYRETYNEFKTTLYDDFKRVLDIFDLPNKFRDNDEIKNFKVGKSKIHFLGDGKHGGGCDYAFFNEVMMQKQSVFDQVEMRCRKFWWMDYNPSFSQHWVFDRILGRDDVAFLRTTYKDNPHISATELNKIRSYEPWEEGSYDVIDNDIYYNSLIVDENNQPPPHQFNIDQGTADEFMWRVYGLGLRGSLKGRIFKKYTLIDDFPDLAFTFGNDFGFTNDPNALVKYAQEGNNIYLELLSYSPIDNVDDLEGVLISNNVSQYVPITADSSDKYTSERKGTVQMVRELFNRGWEISKVSKTKGLVYWLNDMKNYKIHVVKNHLSKKAIAEFENYLWKEVNGIYINQPIDKWNHFIDAARYAHMSHASNNIVIEYEE